MPELTWASYCDWRATKCPVRTAEDLNSNILDLERLQAIIELGGEVGEVAETLGTHGPQCFDINGEGHDELIDELGDVIFTATWVLDAWQTNVLRNAPDVEIEILEPDDHKWRPVPTDYVSEQIGHLFVFTARVANLTKKQVYRDKIQNSDEVLSSMGKVLVATAILLRIAHSNMESAIRVNIDKINNRPPVPGAVKEKS